MLSTRPSKQLSKRSISNEDGDTPSSCVSPPPTKQEKTVSSRLSKHSENIKQHQKSPVKDSADPLLSVSKLPTRGQRSSDKLRSRKPQHSPSDNSDKSKQDSSQNTNTDTTVKASEGTVANRRKDSASGDRFIFKSVSTEEESKQSSTSEIKLKEKETNKLDSITSPTSTDISTIQSIQNNDAIFTANAKVEVTQVADPLPGCDVVKAIPAQSPVADDNNAETDIKGRPHEGKEQAKLESSSHTQSDKSAQDQETLLPKNSPREVDISETTQLILNIKPDLIREKETNSAVLAQDTIPGNEDVNDMSAKPVVGDTIHSEIMTHFDEEGVIENNVSVKATKEVTFKGEVTRNSSPAKSGSKDQDAESKHVLSANSIGVSVDGNLANTDQQEQNEKGQTTNIILANDTLPSTLSIDSVKSKEDVGRKLPEALNIQTETVTVCEFPKNVENQTNKEPLLLAEDFERQKKGSKPTEKLNDAAVESSEEHSQSSCREEFKGITTEDEAEEEVTKPEKPSDLSLEEKSLQPDSEKGPQTVVTDALEEKSTKEEQARSVLHETTATVADKKHECEILLKEKSGSKEAQQAEQKMKASTVKNERLLTKDDKVKDESTDVKDKHAADIKEKQTPEIKATSTQMPDAKGNEKQKSLPNKTAQSEVSNQEDKKDFLTRDQLEDVKRTEENANRPTESKYPNANLEQKPETNKAPNKAMETDILLMDTTQKLTDSTESERKTETKNSSAPSLVNETVVVNADSEISIQQNQRSIIIGDQDEGIIKPEKNKSTESKCPNNKLEQEPERGGTKIEEKTMESQKTDTQELNCISTSTEGTRERTDIKNSSLSVVNNPGLEAANLEVSNEKKSVIVSDQIKATEKEDKNKTTESKHPNSNIQLEPDTVKTKALEKTSENLNIKTDTIQELNSVSTSAEGATEKTESKDLSEKSLNGVPTMIANSEVSNQQVQKPIIIGDQDKNITKPDKNKLGEAPEIVSTKVQEKTMKSQKADTTQELNSVSTSAECTRERTETKDSTLKSLVNTTGLVETSNSEVSNQKDRRIIVRDQIKDTEKVEKNVTEFKHPNSNLQQGPQSVRTKALEKTRECQNKKLDSIQELNSISSSAKGTKEKTETKDSSVKSFNLTPTAIANSKVGNQDVQIPVAVRDQDENITKLEKSQSTESNVQCPNKDLKQETDTVRKEKASESQIPELKGLRTNVLSSQEAKKKPERKDSPKEIAIENANSDVSTQKDLKPSTVTNEHKEIKKTEKNTGQATDSKAPNTNQEHEPKTVTKESKLPDKSSVSTTEKVATKSENIHKQQNTVNECVEDENEVKKQEDKKINTSKIYVKQESEPILVKDASSKIFDGEQKDKSNSILNKTAISTNVQRNDEDTNEKIKTGSGLKQELQTLRKETILNVSDTQKPTKPTLIVSPSLPATIKPSTLSEGTKMESPSSWLDVEYKQKQKKEPKKRLNASASEDESLELEDFDDFIRSIKEGGTAFALPPKRHVRKKSPSPSPHFALPAIKEDHFERTFDPEEFQFGLRKNGKSLRDPSPAMVIKQKAANREGRTLGKREQGDGLPTPRDQMKSLDEVEGKDGVKEGTETRKERQDNGEEPGKLTSRLERMSILSSLLSSPRTSRKTKEEITSASNSPLSSNQQQDFPSLGKQGAVDTPLPGVSVDKEGMKSTHQGQLVGGGIGKVSEATLSPSSPPPLPSFSEIKLPDHLEKYLKKNTKESEASQGSTQMTKTKLNPEGSTVMDQPLTAGVLNVDAGLPLTTKYNQQKPQNEFCSTKTKVGI